VNRLEVFISQLDGLVVFLSAAHAEVFQTIKQNELTWFPESQNPKLPETFESYRVTVSNAAFLLGYAYFEAFLADLARDIYLQRPTLLPREKQITFKEVLGTESKAEILQLMIEKEIRSVFYGKIETVRTHFDKIFHTPWPASTQIIEASRMRNCLMHNGGIVNEYLSEVSKRVVNSSIRLESDEVHGFGIMARTIARSIWDEANRRHFQ
jgi:hypothetical protein